MIDVDVKRVAVIGAGPAGAITIDALAKEEKFDLIRVFERREGPGGCWYSSVYGWRENEVLIGVIIQDWRHVQTSNSFKLCIARDKNCRSSFVYSSTTSGANTQI